ncbi:hypothetical protein LINGRAHAP2_LOCUS22964 [Linum grandiflorum]
MYRELGKGSRAKRKNYSGV